MARNRSRVRVTVTQDNMGRLRRILDDLNKYSVEIGIFASDDSFYAMIANVHEFGITIKPKRARMLTIPVNPKAHGKRARDFPDIFRPRGKNVLAIPAGNGEFEVLFALMESVTIPERSFVRSTFDEKENVWYRFLQTQMNQVFNGRISVYTMFDRIGAQAAGDIQEKMTRMSPGNAPATSAAKRSSNPLVDTGGLRQRVTWKVVRRNG